MRDTQFDLTGKVAVVTGARRGLGQYFGRALAKAGADLVITSRKLDDLKQFQAEIEAMGRRAFPLQLDLRDETSIRSMAPAAIQHYGHIDILVNNAGCNVRKAAVDVSWDDWNLVLDTNLRGSFFVATSLAPHMIANGYGRIINVGSVTSVFGYAGIGPYCASRGGIKQLTMSLADEWGASGITVNCLAPGWFKTQQNSVLYENAAWVEYLKDRIPLKRPRPTERSEWRHRFSCFRRKCVYHRPDAAHRWRYHYRRDSSDLEVKSPPAGERGGKGGASCEP